MNRLLLLTVGAGAFAAVAAGCSSSATASGSSPSSMSPSASQPATPGGVAVVKAADSPSGKILVDGSGRTLYLYKPDTGTTPTCTGSCASIWPPDTTTGKPQASGVNAALLATTARPDHTMQVTFHGHPLYYFSHDTKPGQINGQGFMGIWYVVSPSGTAITMTPAPSTSGGSSGGGGGGGYGY